MDEKYTSIGISQTVSNVRGRKLRKPNVKNGLYDKKVFLLLAWGGGEGAGETTLKLNRPAFEWKTAHEYYGCC